jgi:hypothetical protein
VIEMRRVLLPALLLMALAGCAGPSTTDEMSYQVDEAVTALVVDARAAAVEIESGDGPVTVTEKYKYSGAKPTTAHAVQGKTLRLTESGCGDDDARCQVEYLIRMPRATSADITVQAGALRVNGLSGAVTVHTEAGAVEATALASDQVSVTTKTGAIGLAFTEPPASVQVSSELGAVEVGLPRGTAYAVDVKTEVGKATVSVDKDAASEHRVEVRTEVGAVKIEPSS